MAPPPRPDHRSDLELVSAINDGDRDAFESLYFRHRDWAARLAYRFTGDWDEALDVLQETFAYLARKFPGFELTASMTTFLYPVVKHLALAARRKRRRMVTNEALPEIPVVPLAGGIEKPDLSAALAGLSEEHREALLMRYVDDMSLGEIAAALRIPLGTVKSRLHHAICALRASPTARRYFEVE